MNYVYDYLCISWTMLRLMASILLSCWFLLNAGYVLVMVYVLVKCYLVALLRMASVNVNGAGGVAGEGFVTAASLVPGIGMATAGAIVQPLPATGGNGDGAAANAGGHAWLHRGGLDCGIQPPSGQQGTG